MIPESITPAETPRIEPIWEYLADGTLSEAYERYKTIYQIPWVGVFALAFARHRHSFDLWQENLAELSESRKYVETVLALRQSVEEAVKGFAPPPIAGRLRDIGYSDRHLLEAAEKDGDPENLLALTRFFTWLIPGLFVNVAFFHPQLEG